MEWLVALTAGVTTIGGVALGAFLSQRSARAQADATSRQEQRHELRSMLSEFLHAGRQWCNALDGLSPAANLSRNDPRFWVDWWTTESGQSMVKNSTTMDRLGGELRIVVKDDALRTAVVEAMDTRGDGDWSGDNKFGLSYHADDMRKRFDAIEQRATALLQGDV